MDSQQKGADRLPLVAVVLAAGRGTRMQSDRPKVLHEIGGQPLLWRVLETARQCGCKRILCVVGHAADQVRRELDAPDITWVLQSEQKGTGDALARVESELSSPARLLILSGDVPLMRPQTLGALIERGRDGWGAMAVAELEVPGSLGRVVSEDGVLTRIVEASDASSEELSIQTINAGIYVLPAPEIFEYLRGLEPANNQGELYLTDALGSAAAEGAALRLFPLEDPQEALGINDRRDLVRAERALVERKLSELMDSGVTVMDAASTVVEPETRVGQDSILHPGVTLRGETRVGRGCVLERGAWLRDAELGDEVVIEPYSVVDGAVVSSRSRVGPFARLRPGAVIGEGSKIGNFVEIKNSQLGSGVKAGHLAYIGDTQIGDRANIGAGAITCNYDGERKHRTKIGREAFIGSDTMLVAPVEIGDGATTAAGSVITIDVPEGALGVERGRQRNIEGWAERLAKRVRKAIRADHEDRDEGRKR